MKNELLISNKFFKTARLLTLFLLIILFLSLFIQKITAFNQDLGRHLKLGEIIVQQKFIPRTNHFSYTYPDFPFFNHHWFTEVIFYLSILYFGLNSLILLKVFFCFIAFFALLFMAIKTYGWEISFAWGLLLLILFGQRNEVRPEIFSYFFLTGFLIILFKPATFKKFFWLLPIIQILWVNSHIYFFLGPILLTLYLVSIIITDLKKRFTIIKIFTIHYSLFTIHLISFFVCLFNPNFLNGALYPFNVFKNYGYRIVENQSIPFMSRYYGQIYNPYFIFIFLISSLTFIFTLKKQNFFSLANFLFFSFFSFYAIRNIPLFALVMLLPVGLNLFFIKKLLTQKLSSEVKLNGKLFFYFILLPSILIISWQNITNSSWALSDKQFGFGKTKGAEEAVNFIIANNIPGPLFNNFDIGSYLIFRLYPGNLVFVDGRPEAYPKEFLQQVYIPMQERQDKWEEQNQKYHFNFIFFSHTDITPWAEEFLKRINKDTAWQIVYLDDYALVLVKKNELNKEVINKYAVTENNFHFNCKGQLDCVYRLSRALNILGWKK